MTKAIYPDTSFLISLYGNDGHTQEAQAAVVATAMPLLLSDLNRVEFENALRLLQFRKLTNPRFTTDALAALHQDEAAGLLRPTACDWPSVFVQAQRVSQHRTIKGGHRTMDLLHVAVALDQSASHFYSFDDRQRKLASQEGLVLNRPHKI